MSASGANSPGANSASSTPIGILKAKFDFEGAEEEELSFKTGETIQLFYKDESGWAKGRRADGKVGWFPFDYTDQVENGAEITPSSPDQGRKEEEKDDLADIVVSENDRDRFNIAKELLLTERAYLGNLVKVIKFWLAPLKDGSIIETKYLQKIFCNIEEIHSVTTKLLVELEGKVKNWTENSTIGDAFIQLLPEFVVYIEYLKNHHAAIFTVNGLKDRKSFLTWMQTTKDKKEMEGLDLLSFLIMPVQRILRYKLLLDDLLKHTKAGHPDKQQLAQSLKQITEIAENVNESIKEEENFQKLCVIQKSFVGNVKNIVMEDRKFIREGPIMKVCRKADKQRWFFLFNDVLVYASISERVPSSTGKKPPKSSVSAMSQLMVNPNKQIPQIRFLLHRMMSLDSIRVKPLPDTDTLKNAFQMMTTEEKSFVVYTETPEEKDAWVNDMLKLTPSSTQEIAVAPVWIPDKLAKNCMVCNKGFNVVLRRHHCRHCGKVVCGSCSSQKTKIAHTTEMARVCNQCYEELNGRRPSLGKTGSSQIFTGSDGQQQFGNGQPSSPSSEPTSQQPPPDLPPKPDRNSKPVTGTAKPTPPQSPSQSRPASGIVQVPSPAVPVLPKPPIRPKSMAIPDLETLKKKIDELAKILSEECTSRIESENKFKQEIQRLTLENQQLKKEVDLLKQSLPHK